MDGLSVAASLIAVVQVSGSIISLCYNYIQATAGAKREVFRLLREVQSLRNVVERLLQLLEDQKPQEIQGPCDSDSNSNSNSNSNTSPAGSRVDYSELPVLRSLASVQEDSALASCLQDLQDLERRLQRPVHAWQQQQKTQARAKTKMLGMAMVLMWPLREHDVTSSLDSIARLRGIMDLALAADTAGVVLDIQQTASNVQGQVLEIRASQLSQATESQARQASEEARVKREREALKRQLLVRWLRPAEGLEAKHRLTSTLQTEHTADWLLSGEAFTSWMRTKRTEAERPGLDTIWLHGIPGCGKTVLSSAVIRHIHSLQQTASTVSVGYFYFDFGNASDSKKDVMLRSLLAQLAASHGPVSPALLSSARTHMLDVSDFLVDSKDLDADSASEALSRDRKPPKTDRLCTILLEVVSDMASQGQDMYIVLDALDECADQEQLPEVLQRLLSWVQPDTSQGCLRIFLTSRHTRLIAEAVSGRSTVLVAGSQETSEDIALYIRTEMEARPDLRRWPSKLREKIQNVLASGAHGMFRWVYCQLAMLRNCVTIRDVHRALAALPSTLAETYTQTIRCVDVYRRPHAARLLLWLAMSPTPLELRASGDVLAVDPDDMDADGHFVFDEDLRVPDVNDIPAMCTTLVRTLTRPSSDDPRDTEKASVWLHLAHYTVQEYLLSDRFLKDFLGTDSSLPPSLSAVSSVSLAHKHAAMTLLSYLLSLREPLTKELLQDRPLARHAAEHWHTHYTRCGAEPEEMTAMVSKLLDPELSEYYKNWARLYEIGKPWRTPDLQRDRFPHLLYYASMLGLEASVRGMLAAGTQTDVTGDMHKSCLQAAAFYGHTSVVRVLLAAGADVDGGGGLYDTPLTAAAAAGHTEVVRQLLQYGASVDNTKAGLRIFRIQSPLMEACRHNRVAVVRQLLAAGARVDIFHLKRFRSTPLALAAQLGHVECVSELLPCTTHWVLRHCFSEAFDNNPKSAITTLPEETIRGLFDLFSAYIPGTALSHAQRLGYKDLVSEMLSGSGGTDKKRPPPPATRLGSLAVQPTDIAFGLVDAIREGQIDLVRQLMASGVSVSQPLVDINGEITYALFHATRSENTELVDLFLQNGAHANAADSKYGPALPFAVYDGNLDIVRLLVEKGHASTETDSYHGCPLHIAVYNGDMAMIEYLVAAGANVNHVATCDRKYSSHTGTSTCGIPLEIAIVENREEAAKFLLYHGACLHANIMGSMDRHKPLSILGYAVWIRHNFVDMLLEAGAPVGEDEDADKDEDGDIKTPRNILYWAIVGGDVITIRRVLDAGASVHAMFCVDGNTKMTALAAACRQVRFNLYETYPSHDEEMRYIEESIQVVRMLLDAGADPNRYSHRLDGYDEPALQTLVRCTGLSERCVVEAARELIVRGGADVNATAHGEDGWTALHQAARHDHPEVIRLLLDEMGADPHSRLANGSLAAHLAAEYDQVACLEALLQRPDGLDLDGMSARSHHGRTLLHWAADGGAADAAAWLLAHGADITAEDELGMTAHDYAAFQLQRNEQENPTVQTGEQEGHRGDWQKQQAQKVLDVLEQHGKKQGPKEV